jgi:hypothetical protein
MCWFTSGHCKHSRGHIPYDPFQSKLWQLRWASTRPLRPARHGGSAARRTARPEGNIRRRNRCRVSEPQSWKVKLSGYFLFLRLIPRMIPSSLSFQDVDRAAEAALGRMSGTGWSTGCSDYKSFENVLVIAKFNSRTWIYWWLKYLILRHASIDSCKI